MPKQLSTYLLLLFLLSLASCKDSSEFKLCGLGICKPYYFTGLSYQGGLYQVEKEIKAHYTPVIDSSNNGVVRVSYKVNCEGELGDVTYETYNLDFAKADLNPRLTEQLVNAVSKLSAWNPGKIDGGNSVNSHGFLAFKIVNGEITEILPK